MNISCYKHFILIFVADNLCYIIHLCGQMNNSCHLIFVARTNNEIFPICSILCTAANLSRLDIDDNQNLMILF